MIEATVVTRSGNTFMVYANSFQELFKHIVGEDVVELAGRTISLAEMRQGKENLTNG